MNVTKHQLLYRRNGVFYYWQQLRQRGQPFELRMSLRTNDPSEAKKRYFSVRSFVFSVINRPMDVQDTISPDQIRKLVHDFFIDKFAATMDADFNDLRLQRDPALIAEAENALQGLRESHAVGVEPAEYDEYIEAWSKGRLKRPASAWAARDFLHELMFRADTEVIEIFLNRMKHGLSALTIRDPYFVPLQEQVSLPVGMLHTQSQTQSVHVANRISLAHAGQAFLATKTEQSALTVNSYRDSFKILLETMPSDATVDDFDEDAGLRLLAALKARPTNFTKLKAGKINLAGRKTLSDKTIAKHWIFYSQFFKWCIKKKYISHNPLADITAPKKRAAKSDRDPFSRDQIVALFSSPLFTGFKSRRRRTEPGKYTCKDVDYWCTLIAYYTGARSGEILQLPRSTAAIFVSFSSQMSAAIPLFSKWFFYDRGKNFQCIDVFGYHKSFMSQSRDEIQFFYHPHIGAIMTTFIPLIVVFLFPFIAIAYADNAATKGNMSNDCSRSNQVEMNQCLLTQLDALEKEVNTQVELNIAQINNPWGKEANDELKQRAHKTQDAWVQYRDGYCTRNITSKAPSNSSTAGMEIIGCKIQMTKMRLEETTK